MKTRCSNPNAPDYARYGGRGIRVCARWVQDFTGFLVDVGERPSPTHTLDRINNDGNYEPGNVRWATRAEQVANRRPLSRTAVHGTRSRYVSGGCRCNPCRAANTAYQRARAS